MDSLPDEIVLHILQYLPESSLARCQQVSRRLLKLCRDTALWKQICFISDPTHSCDHPEASREHRRELYARWDPSYPGESIDFYEEYLHTHTEPNVIWKDLPDHGIRRTDKPELSGLAVLRPSGSGESYAVAAVDDGSIAIHDLCPQETSRHVVAHSKSGLLTPHAHSLAERQLEMSQTNAIEVVSIDQRNNRGYFAVGRTLHEVDLTRLSTISSRHYNQSLAALSSMDNDQPLLVGTNQTIQIHDRREPHARDASSGIILPDLKPAAIVVAPDNDTICIGGRFKSLLQYSLRAFPRLVKSAYSGAHFSSLTAYPYSTVPPYELFEGQDFVKQFAIRKSTPGHTIVGAGVYKGKGSVELFSTYASDDHFVDRRTASASKIFCITTHGSKLVYSDGQGNITWKRRNGFDLLRTYRVGETKKQPSAETETVQTFEEVLEGLWAQSNPSTLTGTDIVRKLVPYHGAASASGRRPENLLLWRGDGRLGVLGFGPRDGFLADEFHDAVEEQAQTAAEKAHYDAERQYAMAMRRALERNADEVRFMRGLGMGELL